MKRSEWTRAAFLWGWTTSALTLTRLITLIVLEVKLRQRSPDIVLWDISHQADDVALHAGLAALIMIALARSCGASRIALFIAAIAGLSALSGWPGGEVHQIPGFDSMRNRVGWGLFLLGSLGLSLLQRRAFQKEQSSKLKIGHAALALATPFALPALFYWAYGTVSTHRAVVNIVREFAFEEEEWEVTRTNPYARPSLGNLTPSFDYRVDGGDRPAILMPPPSELSIIIKEEDAGSHFQTAIGIGRDTFDSPPEGRPQWTRGQHALELRFEVELDGASVLDETLTFERGPEADLRDRSWRYVGMDGEIPVEPGQQLTLRTSWVDPVYQTDIRTPVASCGFGSPQLVRRQDLPRADSTPDTPNIVLIVMDTLRADRMSCYGYPVQTTPNLDRLAERGLLHEQARATSSWTWPSTASILTGLQPEAHGVVSDGQCYLDSRLRSLPEALEERGYTTVAYSCNPLIVPNKNFQQGFERFDSFPTFRKTDQVISSIKNFMTRYAGKRFFLYIHLVDPHEQYELSDSARERVGLPSEAPEGLPNRPFLTYRPALLNGRGHDEQGLPVALQQIPRDFQEWINGSYDAAVATADEYVGEILDQLSELELDDETVILFTSDHGEELFEHGLLAHGHSLHEELVRVPLILAGPGIPKGARTDKLISNRHIAPTLAKFGGVELPDIPRPQDLSLPSTWLPEPIISSTMQGWWNGRHRLQIFSITTMEWVLHWAPTGAEWAEEHDPESDGMWRLYQRLEDPHEEVDLAEKHPEVAAQLLAQLKVSLAESRARATGTSIGVGAAGAELLRGIGYTGEEEE